MLWWPRNPKWVDRLYPHRTFRMSPVAGVVHLTFDDGPDEGVTPAVLDLLAQYEMQGTFFCIGDQVVKNPEIYNRLRADGHAVGNHTQWHENARQISSSRFRESVNKASQHINRKLFRPPYGRLPGREARWLCEQGYEIVMWDVLSGDFDPRCSSARIARNVINNMQAGSIIVLHDNARFKDRMLPALPLILKELKSRNWTSKAL